MRHLNLSFFNKILFLIISVFVQCIYSAKVMAYTTTSDTSAEACANTCTGRGYPYGLMGGSLQSVGIEPGSSSTCYCLSENEFMGGANCSQQSCSSMVSNSTGKLLYSLSGGSCSTYLCQCNSGYGGNASSGSCTACLPGYYKASTGNTSCSKCAANKATNTSGTGATACNWCVAYYPSYGTTPSSAAAYSNAGSAGQVGNCYIPSSTTFTDSTGTWHFTSNCYQS